MNACFHKQSIPILDRHVSEQISRASFLRIAWKHATAARVKAASATGSVSNVNATAQPKTGHIVSQSLVKWCMLCLYPDIFLLVFYL